MVTESEAAQIVTAAVAVAGLGLSVYNAIKARRDKNPRVTVNVTFGFLGYGPQLSELMMFLTVRNPGERTITVNSVSLRLPNKQALVFPCLDGDRLPNMLEPGTALSVWTERTNVVNGLRKNGFRRRIKLVPRAGDTLGNEYRGKPFTLDLA